MKCVFIGVDCIFDTSEEKVNSLVIENPKLMYTICYDLYNQILGNAGKSVISSEDKVLDVSKNVELINHFVPFEINSKALLSKLSSRFEGIAVGSDFFEKTMQELSNLEKYLYDISDCLTGNIVFSKLSVASLLKASGLEFENAYDNLAEKVIDYMELVREYDKDKLFILVNFRSFISDEDAYHFIDTVKRQLYNVILIEGYEHKLLLNEKRYLVDEDLCEVKIS